MMSSKIVRSSNLTTADREMLVDVVLRYKHVIENKRTDAVSVSDKERAWQVIATEFNALTVVKRTGQQLKTAYENLKRRSKKIAADDKVERVKTGGGTFVPQVGSVEEKVLAVLGNRATPLINPFDSDAVYNSDSASRSLGWIVSCDNSAVTDSHIMMQVLDSSDSTWFDAASWAPVTSTGTGSGTLGQSTMEMVSIGSILPLPDTTQATSTSAMLTSSHSSTATFVLPEAASTARPESLIQSAAAASVLVAGTSTMELGEPAHPDSRKWAGRRRPKVQRCNSSTTHMEAVGKFQQLADDKRCYYQQKLEMRRLEHEQKMKVMKLKELLLSKQLQQVEE